jgi:hypothetical protein
MEIFPETVSSQSMALTKPAAAFEELPEAEGDELFVHQVLTRDFSCSLTQKYLSFNG